MLSKERVRNIIEEVIEIDSFSDQDRFAEDFGVDSMMILELVTNLEKEYAINIPEEQYTNMGSFEEVYSVVSSLVQEQKI